ncbi:MAG: alanine racemase [Deltaproteobacteria bacterium RIFOXYD12_FULL_50_9]|nr:MAG: alanine racemase [Deltaproteobacteria bacterium RIFOXYD12_FULL_50_9]
MATHSLNRVEIDLAALRHNYRVLRLLVGPHTTILAIVKSDAYGHGLLRTAQVLAEEGASAFGVAETEEGVALREAGITGDIIILLGARTDDYSEIIAHRLQVVVYDAMQVAGLSRAAVLQGKKVAVHLKIDTGMGRLGVMPAEAAVLAAQIAGDPGVELKGVLSHFSQADAEDSSTTLAQNCLFAECVKRLPAAGVYHIANSAALLRYPESSFDMVRPGITLYGCYPSSAPEYRQRVDLKPVMSFLTSVIQVKDVPAGYGISYGHLFVTDRPSRLAVLPVGYNDGYLRRLTGRASVLIHGKRAPVVGRICMNASLADVTEIAEVRPGDEVVLMGCQESEMIAADEVAGWLETINYEVLCLFGNRNRREYSE